MQTPAAVCNTLSSLSCGERPSTDSSESGVASEVYESSWCDPQGPRRATALYDCDPPTACDAAAACDRASGRGRVAAPLSLQSVASTLEYVQGAMCKINRKMSKTGRAVAQVARRLRNQGQKVQRLQNRLRAVEPKLNLCAQRQALAFSEAPPAAPPPYPGCCCSCCAPLDLCASCPACPQPCPQPCPDACAPRGGERCGGRSHSRPRPPCLQRQPCLATHASLHCRRSCYAVPPPCIVQRASCCKGFACAPAASSPSCAWGRPPAPCACAPPRVGEPPCGCDAAIAHCASPLARRLFKMAHDGRAEDVWHLLVAGADVNCLNSSKWTPLHRAAAQGRVCVVAMLLEWGARVDAPTSYGHTPLHLAAAHDCSGRCAEVLLRAGADANCVTRALQTPLHLAAYSGNAAALQALLRAGARPCACDDEGRTPYDVARGSCRRLLRACSRRPHRASSCCADSLRCSDTLYAY